MEHRIYFSNGDELHSFKDEPFLIKRKWKKEYDHISEEDFNELKNHIPVNKHANLFMPKMYLQLTERCNLRCRHCFVYADNEICQNEWEYNSFLEFLDQAKECGVLQVIITGGEPTLHKDFLEMIDAICERGMYITEINTNGLLLTKEMLNHFKELGINPDIKISFDGIGIHDYMRGVKGVEKKALEAIELSIKMGFPTYSQTQINRKTLPFLKETLDVLDKMGCFATRLLRTSDSPRWVLNDANESLNFEEYFETCFDIVESYLSVNRNMALDLWQFVYVDPKISISYGKPSDYVRETDETAPICESIRHRISISADGEVYPCLEFQGYCKQKEISFGNVLTNKLSDILNEGIYANAICATMHDRFEHNDECHDCKYRKICTGGCPALGTLCSGGDYLGIDKSKCVFFKNGYYERLLEKQRITSVEET